MEQFANDFLVKCPVPGCNHRGTIITKVHYRSCHNLERKKAEKLYGKPEKVKNPLRKKLPPRFEREVIR